MDNTYTIHTLAILRNEIKNYNAMKLERRKAIEHYVGSLITFQDKLFELNEELLKIKSPGGDGLGGYVSESSSKYNYIIEQKEDIYQEQNQYIKDNYSKFSNQVEEWNKRIRTVERYLSKLKEKDKEFIEDLYVDHLGIGCIMKKYYIDYKNNVYRKADNILRKVLG